ncbi:hypothetical protein D3C81_1261760 [compost metagenome]
MCFGLPKCDTYWYRISLFQNSLKTLSPIYLKVHPKLYVDFPRPDQWTIRMAPTVPFLNSPLHWLSSHRKSPCAVVQPYLCAHQIPRTFPQIEHYRRPNRSVLLSYHYAMYHSFLSVYQTPSQSIRHNPVLHPWTKRFQIIDYCIPQPYSQKPFSARNL